VPVDLAPLTTLGIGGPAARLVDVSTEADVVAAVREGGDELFILGGGSNVVIGDGGVPGLVARMAMRGVDAKREDGRVVVDVAAGEDWDAFVARAVDEGWRGVECLGGIPGLVGGTPIQNVGAYGQEVSSVIDRVRAIDLHKGAAVEFTNADCAFAYRKSRFNTNDRGRYAVTRVDYRLNPGGAPTLRYADLQRTFDGPSQPSLAQVAEAVRRIRQSKGMLLVKGDPDCRSAGSFFKNPVVTNTQAHQIAATAGKEPPHFPSGQDGSVKLPAAWLIEHAGFSKGFTMGAAAVSSRHTLALINRGNATASDMMALADCIRAAVEDRFGIQLEREPVLLGF